jgi:hypothetical protein
MSKELKLAVIMAGGSAAGKSTTSKAFAVGSPDEHSTMQVVETQKGPMEKKVFWTFYDNYALAGNHHSGTDANHGPGAVRSALFKCLDSDKRLSIVDGRISSPQWVLALNDWQEYNALRYELKALCLHFDFTPEDLLTRLAVRRGTDKEIIREKMMPRCRGWVAAANKLVDHFNTQCKVPYEVLTIWPEDTTEDIVGLLQDWVEEMDHGRL